MTENTIPSHVYVIDPGHDRRILNKAQHPVVSADLSSVVVVKCPHTVGLTFAIDRAGDEPYLADLPCPCNEPSVVIARVVPLDKLDEIDRNARAYGFDVGQGAPLAEKLTTSAANPFLDPNWREQLEGKGDRG